MKSAPQAAREKTRAAALELLVANFEGDLRGGLREIATGEIECLAEAYRLLKEFDYRAPRVSQICKALERIELQALALVATLEAVSAWPAPDEPTNLWPLGAMLGPPTTLDDEQRRVWFAFFGSSRPGGHELCDLASVVRAWRSEIVVKHGSGDMRRPDRGGRTNLRRTQPHSDPLEELVKGCLLLWTKYLGAPPMRRPQKDDLGRFCRLMFQYVDPRANVPTRSLQKFLKNEIDSYRALAEKYPPLHQQLALPLDARRVIPRVARAAPLHATPLKKRQV